MNNNNQNNDQINSLPEYKIRTMEGDLDKLEGKTSPPEELPIVIAPKIEKPLVEPLEIPPVKPLEIPSIKPIDVHLTTPEPPLPQQAKIETPTPTPTPKTKLITKSVLPEIEDFIVPTPPPQPITESIKTEKTRIEELKKELKTEKIEKLKTENIFESESYAKTGKKTLWLLLSGIILLILIILGFLYWQGLRAETNQTPPPIINNEPQIPDPLISVDETKTLKIENNISLLILLEDEPNINPLKTFRRIVPIKFSAITGKEEILTLSDLIKELNISVYPYVLSEFKNNYTLVLYGQEENEKRLGLIIEVNNSDNVRTQSKLWEPTMAENLYNLFLGEQPQIFTNKNFSDGDHREIPIRFINFPSPDISMDYAVLNNLFIFSTSKESIRAIIDRVK